MTTKSPKEVNNGKPCDPSETNEALKEFDENLMNLLVLKEPAIYKFIALKSLWESSIERARREEREKIEKERYEAFAEVVNESKQMLKFVTIKVDQAVKKERQRVVEMISNMIEDKDYDYAKGALSDLQSKLKEDK